MKTQLAVLLIFVWATSLFAQLSSSHSEGTSMKMHHHGETSSPKGISIEHVTLPEDMSYAEFIPYDLMTMGGGNFGLLQFEQFEFRLQDGPNLFRWDVEGWYGGDWNRLWLKTEGVQTLEDASSGDLELHGYFSRLLAPYWDGQIGLRLDRAWGSQSADSRIFGAVGLEGLSPLAYEMTPTLFVSEDGDVSFRVTATRDLLITQRTIAQFRMETELAIQQVTEYGVGRGWNDVELGFRLRHEIRRQFAPYIGVEWERLFSGTANIARDEGEDVETLSLVGGIQMWF